MEFHRITVIALTIGALASPPGWGAGRETWGGALARCWRNLFATAQSRERDARDKLQWLERLPPWGNGETGTGSGGDARFLEFYREYHAAQGMAGGTPILHMEDPRQAPGQAMVWMSKGIAELAHRHAGLKDAKTISAETVRAIADELALRRKEIEIHRAVELIGDVAATLERDAGGNDFGESFALASLENFEALGLPTAGRTDADGGRWRKLVQFRIEQVARFMTLEGRSPAQIERMRSRSQYLVSMRVEGLLTEKAKKATQSVDFIRPGRVDRHGVMRERADRLLQERGSESHPIRTWQRAPEDIEGDEVPAAVIARFGDAETGNIQVMHKNQAPFIDLGFRRLADFAQTGDRAALDEGYWILMHHTPWFRGSPSIIESTIEVILRARFGRTHPAGGKTDEGFWRTIFMTLDEFKSSGGYLGSWARREQARVWIWGVSSLEARAS